jgi:hypothetical protein
LLLLSSPFTSANRDEAAILAIVLSSCSPSLIFLLFCYYFLQIYSEGV